MGQTFEFICEIKIERNQLPSTYCREHLLIAAWVGAIPCESTLEEWAELSSRDENEGRCRSGEGAEDGA